MLKSLVFVILLSSFAVSAYAQDSSINYFETISKDEQLLTLQNLDFSSCKDFTDTYFTIANDHPQIHMKAIAYDIGLCAEQDLRKARDLYEHSQKHSPSPVNHPIRLALIYKFGPRQLQDHSRAQFLARQTAIYLIPAEPDMRLAIIQNALAEEPVPVFFKEQLNWIETVLQKSDSDKESIAKSLHDEGFQETDFIWSRAKSLKPIPLENLR